MLRGSFLLAAALILGGPAPSRAAVTGLGGLEAVAVSPDGKLVAVGGRNRVAYLVDARTLGVKKRLWIGARIGRLAFTRNSSRLIVEDETDRLRLLDVATGKDLLRVTGVEGMVVSRRAGLLAVRDVVEGEKARLRLLSLDDLGGKGIIEMPDRPSAWTFGGEGKRLVVLSRSQPGEEKRVAVADTPAELKGLARAVFQQKHDGYESWLRLFDLEGKVLRQTRLWYTSDSDSTLLVQAAETTYVFNRGNICARIGPDGKIVPFQTQQRLNQGLGASEDGKYLLTGGFAEGTHGPVAGPKRVGFEIDALAGQAELFSRFAVLADGSAYGVTTGFRLVKIGKEGRIEKVQAVY
jgi:hypothetical protein